MELYGYQHLGVSFLSGQERVLLGDDRGLGKSAQSLRAVKWQPTLILARKVMLLKWLDEIRKWRPEWLEECNVVVLNDEEMQKKHQKLKGGPDVVIANYETLLPFPMTQNGAPHPQRGNPKLPEIVFRKWGTIIMDEAHHFKNRQAVMTKQAYKLKAHSLFLLTANAITNSPSDLWSMLHLIDPKTFRGFWSWAETYCTIEDMYYGPKQGAYPVREVTGWKDPEEVQGLLVGRYLRRTKDEVLDLPPRTVVPIPVELSTSERNRYQLAEKKLLLELPEDEFSVIPGALEKSIRLRQLVACPNFFGHAIGSKQVATVDLLESLLETENRIVVFGWFHKTLEGIHDLLWKKKILEVDVITGDTPKDTVWEIIQNFQNVRRKSRHIILGTIASLGEGVDLYAAKTAVFVEKSYVPSDNEQAGDRLHRIGQDLPVTIYDLRAQDTVDDALEVVLARKDSMIKEVWVASEVLRLRR
jgi:SWI/SNF-related matrix-associated actin-dependent regulator 1 of chromatin subfamily A